jgi:hypothetical protein
MFKQFIIKALALINFTEGIIHLVVAVISFWGIYATNSWDWRVMAAPTTDFFLGIASLFTSYVLKGFVVPHNCSNLEPVCVNKEGG